ncbi:MAG: hypothetical protein JXA21_20680 [Anaerolineae bacterium]|nr:hypothetical protein [Anaerolineae bacterium]
MMWREYLEQQCDRVEALLAARRTPVRIVGGVAGPQVIRLFAELLPCTCAAAIAEQQTALAAALGATVTVTQINAGAVMLTFSTSAFYPIAGNRQYELEVQV